jgi:dipeptidyl aminopeptidase/acylaminoacyl peptidase
MGEVFRARDTRLGRDVAVKFLSAELAADPQALARFEREGRAVAALSHPNIVALYDVGREGDTAYVVTELLEGATLRERLQKGPLPPRKALDYVRAIADAIAAAHSRGIIHRDLKPENVFVTNDGRIKVLDFGIAHMTASPVGSAGGGETMAAGSTTAPGMMIGTVGYMAPEQVRGAATDPRTDVFALGVLLYEALTGNAAFVRDTPADTVSAILTAEPSELPRISTSAGPATEHIVRRCLEKAPDERFQSARDLSFALEAVAAGTGARTEDVPVAVSGSGKRRLARIAAFSALAAAVAAAAFVAGRAAQPPPPARTPAALFSLAANIAFLDVATVSPDGRYIAYTGATASDGTPVSGIALRRLDSTDLQGLTDSTQAIPPFVWSPDSRSLGYFINASLVVRDLPSGAPRTVADFPGRATGVSWGSNGVVLVGTAAGIYRVPASGGTPQLVMRTDPATEIWRSLPSFLPGGDRFLYSVLHANGSEAALETRAASLGGGELGTVVHGAVGAMYADGHILYGTNGTLAAQPFDTESLKLTGQPRQIAPSVAQNWRSGDIAARASETGVLVFRAAPASDVQFTWTDRAGAHLGAVGAPDSYTNFDVSPDGRRIVAARRDPKTSVTSLALIDAVRGVTASITPRDEEGFDDPTWHPDGRHIVYIHGNKVVMRIADGGDEKVLLPAEAYPDHMTRDGRFVTFGRQQVGFFEAWALDILTPGAKPVVLVPGVTLSDETRFSKNEQWVAYHSNQGGNDQVWVIPFPPTGEKWQISQDGGVQPRWSADGNELFYLNPDGRLMAAGMPDGDPRRAREPKALFLTGLTPSNALDQIAVVGDRFLLRLPASIRTTISSPIQIFVNWTAR